MTIRISTAMMYGQGLAGILNRQSELARVQQQLTTGKKFSQAADDPAGAEAAATLDSAKAQIERFGKNGEALRHRLNLEDGTLGSVSDQLARIRELVIQANTSAQTTDSRQAIVVELRQSLEQLVALGNRDDGTGRYLFGGTQDATPPFTLSTSGVTYAGDQIQRSIDVSAGVAIKDADTGAAAFLTVRNGNGVFSTRANAANTGTGTLTGTTLVDPAQWDGGTYRVVFNGGNYDVLDASNAVVTSGAYVAGAAINFRGISISVQGAPATGDIFNVAPSSNQDLFTTIQNAIAAVQAPTSTPLQRTEQQNAFFAVLEDLSRGEAHISDMRGAVGSRLTSLDISDTERSGALLEANTVLSNLRDLDYAEAASRMQLALTALEAAQQAYSRVNSLSLFDRLG